MANNRSDKVLLKQIQLVHSLHKSRLDTALKHGIKAVCDFDDFDLDMRQDVVYCWLSKEDDKLSAGEQRPDHVYVEVTVDEDRCTVADMEYSSLAMTYRQGFQGRPRNEEASKLFVDIYRVTSVPLSDYKPGIFFTPEVLVRGDIAPESIRLL